MTRDEIIAFIRRAQFCHLATVEDGRPRVRGMAPYRVDDDGIIFHTGKMKALYRQITTNPAVELCFFIPEEQTQVRVSGTVSLLEDPDLKQEIVEARPWLKPLIDAIGMDSMGVFKVGNCSAVVWTFQTNLEPTVWTAL